MSPTHRSNSQSNMQDDSTTNDRSTVDVAGRMKDRIRANAGSTQGASSNNKLRNYRLYSNNMQATSRGSSFQKDTTLSRGAGRFLPPPPPSPPPLPPALSPPAPPPLPPTTHDFSQRSAVSPISTPGLAGLRSGSVFAPTDAITFNVFPGCDSYGRYTQPVQNARRTSPHPPERPPHINSRPCAPVVPNSRDARLRASSSFGFRPDLLALDPISSRIVRTADGTVRYIRPSPDMLVRCHSSDPYRKKSSFENSPEMRPRTITRFIPTKLETLDHSRMGKNSVLGVDAHTAPRDVPARVDSRRQNEVNRLSRQQYQPDAVLDRVSVKTLKVSTNSRDEKKEMLSSRHGTHSTVRPGVQEGPSGGSRIGTVTGYASSPTVITAAQSATCARNTQVFQNHGNGTDRPSNLNGAGKSHANCQNLQKDVDLTREFRLPSTPRRRSVASKYSRLPPISSTPSPRLSFSDNPVLRQNPATPTRQMKRRRSLSPHDICARRVSRPPCVKDIRLAEPPRPSPPRGMRQSHQTPSPMIVNQPSLDPSAHGGSGGSASSGHLDSAKRKGVASSKTVPKTKGTAMAHDSHGKTKHVRNGTLDTSKVPTNDSPYTSDGYSATPDVPGYNSAVSSERNGSPHPGQKLIQVFEDPAVPFPDVSRDFSGIPTSSVSDLLQVWDFVSSFFKTLGLTSFPLRHFEKALVHGEQCSLLDACVVRLVRSITRDPGLVADLKIKSEVVRAVQSGGNKPAATWTVLKLLPEILQCDSAAGSEDDSLQHTISVLKTGGRDAFFTKIDAAGRLRVLCELVHHVSMADNLRECVMDSLEYMEEDKKKAREEYTASRKRLESQIRQLRQDIIDHKLKHGLSDQAEAGTTAAGSALVSTDSIPGTPVVSSLSANRESAEPNQDAARNDPIIVDTDEVVKVTSRPIPLSRKERRIQSAMEERARERRKKAVRDLDLLEDRLEQARGSLRTLKNSRVVQQTRDLTSGQIVGNGSTPEKCGATSGAKDGNTVRTRRTFALEESEDPVRTLPLGEDRLGRQYWFLDGCGRIWIEEVDSNEWHAITTVDNLEALLKWLNPERDNERSLHAILTRKMGDIKHEMTTEAMLIAAEKRSEGHPTRSQTRSAKGASSTGSAVTNFLNYRNTEG